MTQTQQFSTPDLDVTGKEFVIFAGHGPDSTANNPSQVCVIAHCQHVADSTNNDDIASTFGECWGQGVFHIQNRGPKRTAEGAPGLGVAGWTYRHFNKHLSGW